MPSCLTVEADEELRRDAGVFGDDEVELKPTAPRHVQLTDSIVATQRYVMHISTVYYDSMVRTTTTVSLSPTSLRRVAKVVQGDVDALTNGPTNVDRTAWRGDMTVSDVVTRDEPDPIGRLDAHRAPTSVAHCVQHCNQTHRHHCLQSDTDITACNQTQTSLLATKHRHHCLQPDTDITACNQTQTSLLATKHRHHCLQPDTDTTACNQTQTSLLAIRHRHHCLQPDTYITACNHTQTSLLAIRHIHHC